MLMVGGAAGYWRRHQNDKRRFQTSTFLGEMFISVFIGVLILMVCIWGEQFTFTTGNNFFQLLKSNGLAIVMVAVGSYSSPTIISILEQKTQEKLPDIIDWLIGIFKAIAGKKGE